MTYIFITYKAIELFASDRFLQSAENDASVMLCNVLRLRSEEWSHPRIYLHKCEKGLVFYTRDSSYKHGVLFDLTTFKGFSNEHDDRTIVNIFQRTIKYAIRYFEGLPLANCERELPDTNVTVIYPNPFVAAHDVPKIALERNIDKYKKKDSDFLVVYDFGTNGKTKVSLASLNKAYEEIRNINFGTLVNEVVNPIDSIRGFSSVEIQASDTKLDARIGFDAWLDHYLTDVQRRFVISDKKGTEIIEGAAGTGKTLCLILRSIFLLKKHIDANEEFHLVFFTHSLSTKERIIEIFKSNWVYYDLCEESSEGNRPLQSIKVTTLQEWSAEHLGTNSISENEYLDKDAENSKTLQIYYIEEAYKKIKSNLWDSAFEVLCSEKFKKFIKFTSEEGVLELLRQEIAVLIKGRASGDYEKYKNIVRPKYSLPLKEDADYRFVFMIYNHYQSALQKVGQYDSDDIILSALGQVSTPIWNRRRMRDGYDVCVIDETHLFNINELSIFHYVNKPIDNQNGNSTQNIIFAIDKSQAIGDWGVDDVSVVNALNCVGDTNMSKFNTVFRCSPDIVNLAYNILASGVTIFMTFENPLKDASFSFTNKDEAKAIVPEYTLLCDDKESIKQGIEWAEKYSSDNKISKDDILIIGTNDSLVKQIEDYLKSLHKPYECLQSRSDEAAMRRAREGNKFIVSQIDYVGGLEFDAVVIIGVDQGRVPPSKSNEGDAYHVISYAWHSRMYVAVTRARYAIAMYGDMSMGRSNLLYSSIANNLLKYSGPDINE